MNLYLVRHGAAVAREDPKCPEESLRSLTSEGKQKTESAARVFKRCGIEVGLFFASPYLRAVQTAEIFARELKFPKSKIQKVSALLPEAPPEEFLSVLRTHGDAEVICFGHAPNLDRIIARALGTRSPVTALKKSAIALLVLDDSTRMTGRLEWILTPKLAKAAGFSS